MKTPRYISKFEYKIFLILVFTLFSLTICSYNFYTLKETEKREAFFKEQEENAKNGGISFAGPYCFPDKHPELLLINIFLATAIFVTSVFRKTFFLSLFFSSALIYSFVKWYFDTQYVLSTNEIFTAKGYDQFLYKAGHFDLAILFILSIVFFWQISILFRMLLRRLKKESVMP